MDAARPVIGITAAVESAAWAAWKGVEVNICARTYSAGIAAAGGLPVILAAHASADDSLARTLELLDGLVLSGGADIDPAAYGADPDPRTTNTRAERDGYELALARRALQRNLPVLGICRGMEILNVAAGGTLVQHLADAEIHLHTPGEFSDHGVRLEPGSLAARAVGTERTAVRSHHHQGIDRLGSGLVATGWAEPGGAIEAIEMEDRRWALGVLWHTEEERGSPILEALTAAARETAVTA
jgi:putative glutamine amidotransferase